MDLIVVMAVSFHQIVDNAIGALVALGGQVQTDHGRGEAAMAQVLLDATDIDTGFEQMGGIRVTLMPNSA